MSFLRLLSYLTIKKFCCYYLVMKHDFIRSASGRRHSYYLMTKTLLLQPRDETWIFYFRSVWGGRRASWRKLYCCYLVMKTFDTTSWWKLVTSQRSKGCSTIIEEKEVSWSRQHPSRTGPSWWRGCNHRWNKTRRTEWKSRELSGEFIKWKWAVGNGKE